LVLTYGYGSYEILLDSLLADAASGTWFDTQYYFYLADKTVDLAITLLGFIVLNRFEFHLCNFQL
jgi:hypothetical protein